LKQYLDDCIEMLRSSLSWTYDPDARKPFAMIAVGIILASIIGVIGIVGGGALVLVNSIIGILVICLAMLLAVLVVDYFVLAIIPYSLKKKGFNPIRYGVMPFIKSILVMIVAFIGAILPWFDLRLLALNILVIIALVGVVAISIFTKIVFGFLLLLPIMLVGFLSVIYSSLRLAFSMWAFFDGNGVVGSVRKSWELTNGRMTKLYSRLFLTYGFLYGGIGSVAALIILPVYILTLVLLFVPIIGLIIGLPLWAAVYLIWIPSVVFACMYLVTNGYAMLKPPEGAPVAEPAAPGAPAASSKPTAKWMAKGEKLYDQY